jgi:PKD repeat protein
MNLRLTIVAIKLFAVALFCGGCSDEDKKNQNITNSAQPIISSVSPSQISKGQINLDVRISGSNLGGVTQIAMGDGITVHSFNSPNASEIQTRVSVSKNTSAGMRSITITTSTGSATASSLFAVSENVAPVAKFKQDPISPGIDSVVTFDASISEDPNGDIATYQWDFGDGKSGKGKKVTHKYKAPGKYKVQLSVTDRSQANDTVSKDVEVVRNKPPYAHFSVTPGNGTTSTSFSYDASASNDPDGRITDFLWKFGDGKSGSGQRITHTYNREGSFNVELIVTDNKGSKANTFRDLKVEKETGQRCSGKGGHGPGYLFTVVSADRSSRTIVGRFQGGGGCEAYYRCGDIRKGGYPGKSPGTEYWIGTICEFVNLGGGLARMKVSGGKYWPRSGESKLYTWPQLDGCSAPCR